MQVLIVGYSGFDNLGDEAILVGMVRLLRHYLPGAEITVLSRDPQQTGREHGVAAVH